MISDDNVKNLFQHVWETQSSGLDFSIPFPTQFYRGIGPLMWEGQHPGGCDRHLSIFDKYNIIPQYCFNCYKVVVKPRTVVELFKLMVVFQKLKLQRDNSRKCLVETRKEITGTYAGLIYCTGINEGKVIRDSLQKIIAEEVSTHIPVTLKRGCSEYALAYPAYAEIDQGSDTFEYSPDWKQYEELADHDAAADITKPGARTLNPSIMYCPTDAHVMLTWLIYAATIGDTSYLKICQHLEPFEGMDRPPYTCSE